MLLISAVALVDRILYESARLVILVFPLSDTYPFIRCWDLIASFKNKQTNKFNSDLNKICKKKSPTKCFYSQERKIP